MLQPAEGSKSKTLQSLHALKSVTKRPRSKSPSGTLHIIVRSIQISISPVYTASNAHSRNPDQIMPIGAFALSQNLAVLSGGLYMACSRNRTNAHSNHLW